MDGQKLFRESLKVVLSVSPGIEVVGAASACRPDVVLMDRHGRRGGNPAVQRALARSLFTLKPAAMIGCKR
ncbi:hypothetical protein [uncultured Oscillibacter sp.]|uniref:hypothetical protein n=1 Tax=uncultured Oscillibacter sp. TaxID=876091 RepID=UPI0026051E77|nr:hypothetical protein [uncultured Oscillibacter sp.]